MRNLLLIENIEGGGKWKAIQNFLPVLVRDCGCVISLISFSPPKEKIDNIEKLWVFNRTKEKKGTSFVGLLVRNYKKIKSDIIKTLDLGPFDYIIASDPLSVLAAGSVLEKKQKLIYWFHGIESVPFLKISDVNRRQIILKALEFLSWLRSDAVLVPAGESREYLLRRGLGLIRKDKIFVVPNFIPKEYFTKKSRKDLMNFRKDLAINAEDEVILYSGRLVELKNIINLVSAFSLLLKKNIKATLIIAYPLSGSSRAYANQIKKKISQLDIKKKVIMTKDLPAGRLPAVYQFANVTVLPSQIENSPLSLLESLASGTPVLATQVGDMGRILGSIDRNLVLRNGSVESIYKGLKNYLTLSNSETRSIQIKSKKTAMKYSEKQSAAAFNKALKQI